MTSVSRYERLRSLGKNVETPENNFVLFSWVLAIIPSFRQKAMSLVTKPGLARGVAETVEDTLASTKMILSPKSNRNFT